MAIIRQKCVSYDCKGKLIEHDKLSLKCEVCGREYWKDEVIKPQRFAHKHIGEQMEKAIIDNLNNERVATLVEKEFNLSEEMEEAFSSVSKISFLKNKREQEVFKLALQTAFAYQKEFIKRLKENICNEILLCNCEAAEDVAKEIIDKLAGKSLI